MEKDDPKLTRFEYSSSSDEKVMSKRIEQNSKGFILFQKITRPRKPYIVMRIKSFFIKHTKSKKALEFGLHPSGIHFLRLAVFYSESGCLVCSLYVEKNFF